MLNKKINQILIPAAIIIVIVILSLSGILPKIDTAAITTSDTTITIPANADIFIMSEWPNKNLRGEGVFLQALRTNRNPTWNVASEVIYIGFDTSPIPQGATITSATFNIWLGGCTANIGGCTLISHNNGNAGSTNMGLYKVQSTWLPKTITWNNKPNAIIISSNTISGMDKWIVWDITKTVQEWYKSPSTNYGIAIVQENNNGQEISFASKDSYTSKGEYLKITYTTSTLVPTPTPTPTPTPSPTFTPTPTPIPTSVPTIIPAPTIKTPTLSVFDDLWNWMKSSLGLATITGGNKVNVFVNEPYTTTLTSTFTPADTVYTDGTYSVKYGKWYVTDSNKNIKYDSGWITLSGSTTSKTLTYTPTITDKYYLFGTVLNQKYTWINSGWSIFEEVEDKQVQEITVASKIVNTPSIPQPSIIQPTTTTASLISDLTTWINNLFGLNW